jgi:hypothetical protein
MSLRSHLNRKNALRTLALGGIAGMASILPASGAFAATHAPKAHPLGYAPVIECLNWSATEQFFPALGSTQKNVTVVVSGTGSNCENGGGQPYSYGASFFGTLSGTATNKIQNLSGNLAVTWPSDANLSPSIESVTVTTPSAGHYSLYGTGTAGAYTNEPLEGSFVIASSTHNRISTTKSDTGSTPFGVFENFG